MQKGFVKSKFKNLSTRKFIAETNHDFYEWVMDDDNNLIGYKLHKGDVYNSFV